MPVVTSVVVLSSPDCMKVMIRAGYMYLVISKKGCIMQQVSLLYCLSLF